MNPTVKKLLDGDTWAINGIRNDPEEVGLDRTEGWPIAYEQKATNKTPEMGVWNQLMCEAVSALKMKLQEGFISWDPEIDWIADSEKKVYSFVKGSDCKIYRAVKPSGPGVGRVVNPVTDNQGYWEKY